MHMYWSTKKSLGNPALSDRISRNRFQKLFAKLYFVNPEKPQNTKKAYYLDEILVFLKSSFMNARSDCSVAKTRTKSVFTRQLKYAHGAW